MQKANLIKIYISVLLSIINVTSIFASTAASEEIKIEQSYSNPQLISTEDYVNYKSRNQSELQASDEIYLSLANIDDSENISYINIEDKEAVITEEEGHVTFAFEVQEDGMYEMHIEYYPIEGKGSVIERGILINGEYPFKEAGRVWFFRSWKDSVEYNNGFEFDNNGNELRPSQVHSTRWNTEVIRDFSGLNPEPFEFYFSKGRHSIEIKSLSEPMAISGIILRGRQPLSPYIEIKEKYDKNNYQRAGVDSPIIFQAENSLYKSQPIIYPQFDRSSAMTQPFDVNRLLLNIIGGTNWQRNGNWISWDIEVPESGLYKIAFRARNHFVNGQMVNRRLYINGQVPFYEVNEIEFPYSPNWQMITLSDKNQDFEFYFEKDKTYELKLEVSLGSYSEILREVHELSRRLNQVYRQMFVVIGSTPDPNRDYFIDRDLPQSMDILREELNRIDSILNEINKITGDAGTYVSSLKMARIRINNMLEQPHRIPNMFIDFKNSIVALGAWQVTAMEQPLELDYIVLVPEDIDLPKNEAGLFENMWTKIRMFIASFYRDFYSIGDVHNQQESITVWTGTGRDQANVIRGLVSNKFEQENDIPVTLQHVTGATLLPAILAGKGPDIFLSIANTEPVNLAFRGATQSLNKFEGLSEVLTRFHKSALVPYTFDDEIYGLPETQTFPLLFYRTDILSELNLDVPQTWDDVIDMLADLSTNNMQFGIPAAANPAMMAIGSTVLTVSTLDLTAYWSMILQNGGQIYNNEKTAVELDSEISLNSFRKWTDFYRNYGLEFTFDFANRFRLGEIPIGISDITMFSTLSVFAPEINGLWEFTLVPGTRMPDGSIDHSVASAGTGTVMFKNVKNPQSAWKFMEWWSRSEIQSDFAIEMEGILGPAARYPVANLEAVENLPWSRENLNAIKAQWEWVNGIPEVPGSYLVGREISFAFRDVLIEGRDSRESILDRISIINNEIERKRKEFNLS